LFFLSDRGVPQVQRLDVADGVLTAVTGWRAGIIDHLPLADPDVVAVDARRHRDRDDAIGIDAGEPRARLRLLDLRTTPDVFRGRHVVSCGNGPPVGRSPC
jgi:hypothetical protein